MPMTPDEKVKIETRIRVLTEGMKVYNQWLGLYHMAGSAINDELEELKEKLKIAELLPDDTNATTPPTS